MHHLLHELRSIDSIFGPPVPPVPTQFLSCHGAAGTKIELPLDFPDVLIHTTGVAVNGDGLEHFQMIPDSVLFDSELTGQDLRVFAFLSYLYRGNPQIDDVSHREIASRLGISRATVWAALARLVVQGHIRREEGNSIRTSYSLCSDRFTRRKCE